MIKTLKLSNVGPADMELEFGERFNLLTGDNGLGKSFLLDIAFWALTRRWPGEVNSQLISGKMAYPRGPGDAALDFSITGKTGVFSYRSLFDRRDQSWVGPPGRPANPGLVIYAMADGSFAVWDPSRNYWRTEGGADIQERQPAFVFAPGQIWNGLANDNGGWHCEGLLRHWITWQLEPAGEPFKILCKILAELSPNEGHPIKPGPPTSFSLDDDQPIPTIAMAYGLNVPVVHASAGIRRILALTYLLVWSWISHRRAAELIGDPPTCQITVLIDEIESHLHPGWQRHIMPSLQKAVNSLSTSAAVQVLVATHSPLIMASMEPYFEEAQDAWLDLDLVDGHCQITRRTFERYGDAQSWLLSEAFDLSSSRAPEFEKLVTEAISLLDEAHPDPLKIAQMNKQLALSLSPSDDFLFNWQYTCRRRKLL